MTFDIFYKNDSATTAVREKFFSKFIKNGYEFNEKSPDYCIVIGGDGAVLRAVHKHLDSLERTQFICVHFGTLGFFADFCVDEIEKILDILKSKKYEARHLPLLRLDIKSKKGKVSTLYAFNEFTIQNFTQTMIADVLIDDRELELFRGTGFCISTPSGSTAYNKALGGAVVYRDVDCLQLTEIASINHNKYHSLNAPFIMSSSHIITVVPIAQSAISITADFKCWIEKDEWLVDANDEIEKIDCKVSEKNAIFVLPNDACSIKRIKRCFII